MNLSLGIIGLPNVGKSTLFNALLRRQAALVANYPFATIEPNIGVVDVPDKRLLGLVKVVQADYGRKSGDREVPEKIIPSTVKFYDIAGLVEGAHKGEGLGNEFLGRIREVDALVHLVRDFTDENVIRAGSVNPRDDESIINTELILSDLSHIEKILQNAKNEAKNKDPLNILRLETVEKIKQILDLGRPAREVILTDRETLAIKGVNFLTQKPVITVRNVDEKAVSESSTTASSDISLCAKLEAEIASLSDSDRDEFLSEWGMQEPGLNKLIRKGFDILGLQTFLTAGPKEVRSWTIKKGILAPEAAGTIHTDFERGFIGADIISYDTLSGIGSYKKAKEQGLVKLEGKTYSMRDGDVVEFRFNV